MFVRLTLRGVFLSAAPADINDGATGDEVLEVVFPPDVDLDEYALVEDWRPAVWEWCVPAALINRHARVRLLTEDEVGAVSRWAS